MPTIEEDFSDPEDEVLTLPSSGPVGAANPYGAGPGNMPDLASLLGGMGQGLAGPQGVPQGQGARVEKLPEEAKTWQILYPIYLDGKRPYKKGDRRVSAALATKWPNALHIAQACGQLGFKAITEVDKRHPKDWANPGRVRVEIRRADGTPVNARIKDKLSLLKHVAPIVQRFAASHQDIPAGSTRPLIEERFMPHSPAVSHGILASAKSGGGMAGMMGNMFGGPGGDEEEKKEEEKPVPKLKKPKMQAIRGRRR